MPPAPVATTALKCGRSASEGRSPASSVASPTSTRARLSRSIAAQAAGSRRVLNGTATAPMRSAPQKDRRPLETVGQEHRHALLGLDAERAERVAGASGEREELAIRRRASRGDDGGPLAGGAIGRCVEERQHRVAHGESLAEQPVAHGAPHAADAVLPGDLLALGVRAPVVGDRHLVDAPAPRGRSWP